METNNENSNVSWVRFTIEDEFHSRVKMFQNAYKAKHAKKLTLAEAYRMLVVFALNEANIQNPNIDKFQNF